MELVPIHRRVIGLDIHQAQITACAITVLAAEQIRRNLAAKMLVCMAVSTKMRCLPPCVSISLLHRVNGSLRQAAQGCSLPLTRLRDWSHGRLDSKTHARKNDAAKLLRKLTATNRIQPVDHLNNERSQVILVQPVIHRQR